MLRQLMGRCFFCAVVSALQGRLMLAEPVIWGILLDSHHLLNADEDYSGAVSWMSFIQGAITLHF